MTGIRAHRVVKGITLIGLAALVSACTGPRNDAVASRLPPAWLNQLHDLHVSTIRCHYESRGCILDSALEGTFDTDEITETTAVKPVYQIAVGSDALEVRGYFREYGFSDEDASKAIIAQLGPVIDTLDPVGERRAQAHAFTNN